MRKNLGVKNYLLPMPVLVIGTYNEDNTANAMNAAYGSMRDSNSISIYIDSDRKTIQNIQRTKAFTVNLTDMQHLLDADYLGIVSGNKVKNKLYKTSFEAIKSEFVNAPIISFSPITLECTLHSYDKDDSRLIGNIVNVSVEDEFIDNNGKIDVESMNLITYNPIDNVYNVLGETVGSAFSSKHIFDDDLQDEEYEEPSKEILSKNIEKRIERAKKMNDIMEQLCESYRKINDELDEFEKCFENYKKFDEYYSSKNWQDDYNAYELGLIPNDLSLGVLNEDIPYDVLGENYYLIQRLRKIIRRFK